MKNVMDFEPYAAAVTRRDELKKALASAQARHAELRRKLADTAAEIAHPDPVEDAIRVARGEASEARDAVVERWKSEEMSLRSVISRLERGLRDATEAVTVAHGRAHAAAFRADPRLPAIRDAWLKHADALLGVAAEEEAVLDDLIDRGFGLGGPVITRPHESVVLRSRLLDALRSERERLADILPQEAADVDRTRNT